MAELTDEIIDVIREKIKKIKFGNVNISFHGNDFIQISVKEDERFYLKKILKNEIRND